VRFLSDNALSSRDRRYWHSMLELDTSPTFTMQDYPSSAQHGHTHLLM
jgi:hypothetical protein